MIKLYFYVRVQTSKKKTKELYRIFEAIMIIIFQLSKLFSLLSNI